MLRLEEDLTRISPVSSFLISTVNTPVILLIRFLTSFIPSQSILNLIVSCAVAADLRSSAVPSATISPLLIINILKPNKHLLNYCASK